MKSYKIDRKPIYGILFVHFLFALSQYIVISVDLGTSAQEVDKAQKLLDLYLAFLPSLLAQVIAFSQACKNFKHNKWALGCDVIAFIVCSGALFSVKWMEYWLEYSTYIGLIMLLLGMVFTPKVGTETSDVQWSKKRLSKLLAAILALLMLTLAIVSFFESSPAFAISDGIIYIFILVIVLLAWDSVESLSLGSIVTLKKNIKDKEEKVEELTTENRDLRNQLVTMVSTSVYNKNRNEMLINFGDILSKVVSVEPATEADSQKDEELVEQEMQKNGDSGNTVNQERLQGASRYRLIKEIESYAIKRYFQDMDIDPRNIQYEVKFSDQFMGSDPIIEQQITFGAYNKKLLEEQFVQAKMNIPVGTWTYMLYFRISKIFYYAQAKDVKAKLTLVVPHLPQKFREILFEHSSSYANTERAVERLKRQFAPAISNGLLNVVELEITEQEFEVLCKGNGINLL